LKQKKIHILIYIQFNKNSETKGADSLLNMQIKFLLSCRFRGKRKFAKPKRSRVKSRKLHRTRRLSPYYLVFMTRIV